MPPGASRGCGVLPQASEGPKGLDPIRGAIRVGFQPLAWRAMTLPQLHQPPPNRDIKYNRAHGNRSNTRK